MAQNKLQKASAQPVVVISEPTQNVGLVLNEILRSMNFTQTFMTANIEQAFSEVRAGRGKYLIIDDTPEQPAALVLRQQLNDPIVALTPTMVIMQKMSGGQGGPQSNPMTAIGRPMLTDKPVTPGRFAPAFSTLVKVWSQGVYFEISQAAHKLARQEYDLGIQMLTKLTRDHRSQPLVVPTIANFLRNNKNVKEAEKLLLTSLKANPRNLGIVLALSDLYLHAAMPQTALRLITSAEAAFGKTPAILGDKLQAHLMLMDMPASIEILMDMYARMILPKFTKDMLARIYFAQGQIDDLKKIITEDAQVQKYNQAWTGNAAGDVPATNTAA